MGKTDEECPAITLSELCNKHKLSYIDFFTLDVEGYELEVLDGLDTDSITINYLLIECHTINYSFEMLCDYLEQKGFKLITNLSNFNKNNCPTWPGTHQDYLFQNKNLYGK